MEDPTIQLKTRESTGTLNSRRLRASGHVPGSIYGHKEGAIAISLETEVLMPIVASGHKVVDAVIDNNTQKALIQDIQWDTFSREILHFDLLRVDADERVTVDVPIHLRGTSPGVVAGGILEQPHHTIPLECPAIRIPDEIVVRIGTLEMGDAIHVSDLQLAEGITPKIEDTEVLVHIVSPTSLESLDTEEEAEGGTQPERIGEKPEPE